MKRKFSFDIPKLKFGPSKQETQALKQHLAARSEYDSEPPTPKSVRPPLPAITEAELCAACTWVVANYRPSHIPYEGGRTVGVSAQPAQHVDYAAINAAVRREMAEAMPAKVQWPFLPHDQARVDESGSQWPSSDMFRYKPTETSRDLFHQDELETMRQQRSSIMAKADELMANLEETQKVLLSPEIKSHVQKASNQSALSLPLREEEEQIQATQRSDSVGTFASTPRTDATGGAPASTVPTTAYVTPVSQSKRTSHTQSDTYLPPKVTAVDAEWMRVELERHIQAQEEAVNRKASPEQETAAGVAETTPTPVAVVPISPTTVIPRKPVPRRATGESQNFSMLADHQHGQSRSRPISYPASMPTSPFGNPPSNGPPHAAASDSKRESYAKNTRDSVHLVRPSTAQTAVKAEGKSTNPRSRAQSTKSPVQNFSRPSLDATSFMINSSPDISRPESRGRSVDSFRSAVSSMTSSIGNPPKQWRQSPGRRRSLDSDMSAASIGTRVSEASRGRPRMPRHSPPPPPINLNRELPPLPGLDQWKPVQVDIPTESQAAVVEDDDTCHSMQETKRAPRPFPLSQDSLVNRRSTQPLRESPASPIPTVDVRQTVYFDAEPAQQYEQPLAPANTMDPAISPGLSTMSSESHRRNKRMTAAVSPDLDKSMSQMFLGEVSNEPKPSRPELKSTVNSSTAKRHSRIISGSADALNFSRKPSSDDYNRMYDSRYQNMLEVTSSESHGSGSSAGSGGPVGGVRDKSRTKRHWWQGKPKREESWMDAVIKSGSKSGVLLTDQVAGAPIVRY